MRTEFSRRWLPLSVLVLRGLSFGLSTTSVLAFDLPDSLRRASEPVGAVGEVFLDPFDARKREFALRSLMSTSGEIGTLRRFRQALARRCTRRLTLDAQSAAAQAQ